MRDNAEEQNKKMQSIIKLVPCLFVYKESMSRKYHTFIHKWEIQRKTSAAFRPLRGLDLAHVLTHLCDFRTPGWAMIVMHVSCLVNLDTVLSVHAPPKDLWPPAIDF